MAQSRFTDIVSGMRDLKVATLPVALVAIAAFGIFAFFSLADEVRENEMLRIDDWLLRFFRNPADLSDPIGPDWVAQTVLEITTLGGYPVLVTLVAAVIGFLLVNRNYGPALFTAGSIVTGTLASHLLKGAYDRPRPDVVEHLVQTHTASFPSGHATMSAVVYLTLATLIVRLVDSVAVRVYVMCVALFLTFAVGMSRIYLGVHWPSDVAAGWALGSAWACVSWLVVSLLRKVRHPER